jgi:mycofactocin system glycosyltransferase
VIPAAGPGLPVGFVVRLGHGVRLDDGGGAIVGGSPTRAIYLSQRAKAMIVDRALEVRDADTARLAHHLLAAAMADPVLARLPGARPDSVTVVVPTRDRPLALDRLLASVPRGLRVIVVDDCSADAAAIAAVTHARGAELEVLPVNLGPAGARNAGLRLVRTPFVAFVDSDMQLAPDTLAVLLQHFADPLVALAAPRVLGVARDRANWIGRYEDARSSLDMGRRPAAVLPLSPVSWLPAACLVARVEAVGDGFGVDMRVAEDVDLVWRLAGEGWRIRFEPAASAFHEHRVELRDWLGRKAFYGTGAHDLGRRHPANIAPIVLAPWSTALLLAVLAQRRWSLPVAAAITAVAVARIASRLGRSRRPVRVAARLAGAGVVSALFQGSALLLRHWWPVTVAGCLVSRRVRRATLVAALVDVAMEYSRTRPALDPVRFGVLRRLDDLAYGAGVWAGAVRGRSVTALLPRIVRTTPKGPPS